MAMTDINHGEPYFLKADISKAGQSSASINDYIKMRVADNGKILPVQWYDQGRVMNVNGMIPFIEGAVGQWHTDDDDNIVMAPDADYRDWQGSTANTRDGGWADYILTDQMFTQKGIFYGKIGLMDGNGRRLTSIDIWFRVLGNDVMFGLTQKYYSDRVEKLIRQIEDKTDQVIKDARDSIDKQTQASRDALKAKDAEVEATRAEQRIINGQLDNIQDQIDRNQIVRKSEFLTNSEALTASINGKLAKINTNPEAFDTLDELKTKYPEGKSGLFFVGKTKHLYIYDQSNWKDIGELPTAGLTDQQNQILSNAIYNQLFIYSNDQLKAPYTDLDLYPANTIVSVGVNTSGILHKPAELSSDGFTVMTYGPSVSPHGEVKDGVVQVLTVDYGKTFWRIRWGGSFTKWSSSNNQGLVDNAIYNQLFIYSNDQLKAPYTDLDLYPANTIVSVGVNTSGILHKPAELFSDGFTVMTYGPSVSPHGEVKDGAVQVLTTDDGKQFWRIHWGGKFTAWNSNNSKFFYSQDQIKAPYDDLNTFPPNDCAVYATDITKIKNAPASSGSITIKTWGINNNDVQSGTVQLVANKDNLYYRTSWGGKINFSPWKKIRGNNSENAELEYAKPSLSMFGKFGVIGDSYASGVLEDIKHFPKDTFATMTPEMTNNLSWPMMLARKWGTSMLHLAKGGLSTRTWLTDDQGLDKLNSSDPQDIYYLCLGINDYFGLGDSYLGVESDMDSGADSFYGNYGKIIRAIKKKAPLAKIIMFGITISSGDISERQKRFSDAQQKIATHFGIPFISEMDDDLFSSDYYVNNMGSGHPSSYLYGAMAEAFERLIQKAIYRNRDYFYSYGWNGEL